MLLATEPALARRLRANLNRSGCVAYVAPGSRAQAAIKRIRPDVVLLDLDGAPSHDFISEIRASTNVPIVAISHRATEPEKVAALDRGADDYITKPVPMGELLARVRVAVRHSPSTNALTRPPVRTGELDIDLDRRRVLRGGRLVHLSRTEYGLLSLLVAYPDKLLTNQMLLDGVWGRGRGRGSAQLHMLHVYVMRLRKKLEPAPKAPRHLVTEGRTGYCFVTNHG